MLLLLRDHYADLDVSGALGVNGHNNDLVCNHNDGGDAYGDGDGDAMMVMTTRI